MEQTIGELTSVLAAMEIGEVLIFPNGAIAYRSETGWEITLPSKEEEQ